MTNVDNAERINHQVAALLKIKHTQEAFADRHDCCLSLPQFLDVFKYADFYNGERATDFFRLPATQM
jgi:hypothetical protein